MIVGYDVCLFGNISNNERSERLKEMILRDELRVSLRDHDMHRAKKEEWSEDEYNYATRSQFYI